MATGISPQQFFDTVVPNHLKTVKVPEDQAHTYVFRLFGDQAGMWTIDLNRRKVTRGGVNKFDLYMEMDGTDFGQLLLEQLDMEQAFVSGRIRFEGDIRLLGVLGKL